MQKVVIDKPYRFVPPYPGMFWTRILSLWLPRDLERKWGIRGAHFHGVEHLRHSLDQGHGILLACNHCRPCDPHTLGLLCREIKRPFYYMASWHLFMQSKLQAWFMRRAGAFSVYREGTDRDALKTSIQILTEAKRPLIVFPEGVITRTNDRLANLQDGTAFIARAAAEQRARRGAGQVVVHPVALKYYYDGDITRAAGEVLTDIEKRLSWRAQAEVPLLQRIRKIGAALISLKEIEHTGNVGGGDFQERLEALIDHLLEPVEREWLGGGKGKTLVQRVKKLRAAILPTLVAGAVPVDERERRWRQLADIYLAQQLWSYPPRYIRSHPTAERVLETIERFEEDLTDECRIHRPLRVAIQVDEAIPVAIGKKADDDGLMATLDARLRSMLADLGKEATILVDC